MKHVTIPGQSPGGVSEGGRNEDDARCRRLYRSMRRRAVTTRKRYRERGIPDDVYRDTMSDLDVWAGDYRRRHGHLGLSEGPWIEKSLTLKVFKLGRLQFERLEPEHPTVSRICREASISLTGTLALSVHVQAGAPLEASACNASYLRAGPFYAALGETFHHLLFICESWLLNPILREWLPAGSNVVRFQQRYHEVYLDSGNRQMEQRVFGGLRDDPSEYREDTRLQKCLKQALLDGCKAGTACGFFLMPFPAGRKRGGTVGQPSPNVSRRASKSTDRMRT